MSLSNVETQICEYIEGSKDELISLAQQLVQIDSCNPYSCAESIQKNEPIEKAVAEHLYYFLSTSGLEPRYSAALDQRPNVLCDVGRDSSKSLILNGHMDTVPIGDESNWTRAPLGGEIHDGKLYGRGAYDMKGSLASMAFSMRALASIDFSGKVTMAATVDEEPGAFSTLGAKHIVEQGLRADACVVTEPGNDEIKIGSKGLCRLLLRSHGQAEHTGRRAWEERSSGVNAVTNLSRLLVELEDLDLPSGNVGIFRCRRNVITPGTLIKGGHGINIVPEYAEATVDMRLLPGISIATICDALDTLLENLKQRYPAINIDYDISIFIPATVIDENHPIVKANQYASKLILGRCPPVGIAGGASDHHFFLAKGIPSISDFGPQGDGAHAPDEYVEIQSLIDMAKVYALAAFRFCR